MVLFVPCGLDGTRLVMTVLVVETSIMVESMRFMWLIVVTFLFVSTCAVTSVLRTNSVSIVTFRSTYTMQFTIDAMPVELGVDELVLTVELLLEFARPGALTRIYIAFSDVTVPLNVLTMVPVTPLTVPLMIVLIFLPMR